jgi:hypothetical protein
MRAILMLAAAMFGLAAAGATAGTLETPAGAVILTVTGTIENQNGDGSAMFDRAMLERIGTTTMTTVTSLAWCARSASMRIQTISSAATTRPCSNRSLRARSWPTTAKSWNPPSRAPSKRFR